MRLQLKYVYKRGCAAAAPVAANDANCLGVRAHLMRDKRACIFQLVTLPAIYVQLHMLWV